MRNVTLLSQLLPRTAARIPDAIAVEAAAGSPALTYRELLDSAECGAAALRAAGLEPGARVVIAMDGSVDWAIAFWSVVQAGLVAVPVPAAIPSDLLGLVVFHADARVCVLSEMSPLHSARLPPVLRVTSRALLERGTAAVVAEAASPEPRASSLTAAGEDAAVLVFTSGSTARPRAVELSHENLLANLRALTQRRHAAADEALLSVLPPAHVFELVVGQLAPVAVGARIVYAGAPLPNRIVDAIRDRRVTRILLVPAMLDAIAHELAGGAAGHGEVLIASVRARIGSTLRTIAVGGAAVSPATVALVTSLGIGVDVGYGLTEAGPLVSMDLTTECPPGSVGRPLPGVEVRIDEHGEILVRGAGVMRGYFKDAVGSAVALEDHWLRTGDRGRLDGHGFLYITGRMKEAMVTSTGETIHPEEIEPYYASPLFAEHCVVPISGDAGNDEPTLVVVPAPGVTGSAVSAAFASLRKAAPPRLRIASFVRVSMPLPRTAVGKLRRRALAEGLLRTMVVAS
jgi:long-subunit acyl-CoA synthetase (AMP-forming)